MIDQDFEHNSRGHLFWEEWQAAANRAWDADTYLDDLIAKAAPQWAGVDVDAFMDNVRGREPEPDDSTSRREGDEMSDYIGSLYPEWALVIAPDEEKL